MAKRPLQDTPSLLTDTMRMFVSLIQGELKLARAEMAGIVSRAGVGVTLVAIALLIALVALNVLASAAIAYIAANGVFVGLAALIVGGTLIVLAIILALLGKSRLSADALSPNKTAQSVRQDIAAIKGASNV